MKFILFFFIKSTYNPEVHYEFIYLIKISIFFHYTKFHKNIATPPSNKIHLYPPLLTAKNCQFTIKAWFVHEKEMKINVEKYGINRLK